MIESDPTRMAAVGGLSAGEVATFDFEDMQVDLVRSNFLVMPLIHVEVPPVPPPEGVEVRTIRRRAFVVVLD